MAGDEKIQLDITAKDDASDKIHDVADAAGDLEKLSPEVAVTADTGSATADIDNVATSAEHLARLDTELVIRAQIDQAKGQLSELDTKLKTIRDAADDTSQHLDKVDGGGGTGLRGNAIADLTGPLGDASGAASDFAGVFDGLGDAAEAAAGKLGLSEGVASKLSSAIGGLGVAVAAGAAIWSLWTAHAEAARKKAKELEDAQQGVADAIRDGNKEAAVSNFHKAYDAAIASAEKLGLKQADVIRFITGESDAIPGLTTKYHELLAAREANAGQVAKDQAAGKVSTDQSAAQVTAFENVTTALDAQRAAFATSTTAAAGKATADDAIAKALGVAEPAQKAMNRAVNDSIGKLDTAAAKTKALEDGYSNLDDRLSNKRAIEDWQAAMIDAQQKARDGVDLTRDDIRGIEDDIRAAGTAAGLTPIQIQAEIDRVDQGDVDGAYLDMQQKIDAKGPLNAKLMIHPELPPRLRIVTSGGTTILDEAVSIQGAAFGSPGGGSTVNINMPAGSRGVDVVRQVAGQARRSGRRYGAAVVNYARQ